MSEIIKDYGATVDPEVYKRALQGHQYIPQADQCIRDLVRAHCMSIKSRHRHILDIGCGPGRLTFSLAHQYSTVIGLDISGGFIDYANRYLVANESRLPGYVHFHKMDFTKDELPKPEGSMESNKHLYEVLVAQGVLHHMHGNDRIAFIKRCHEVLRDDGILIVGDEFIRDYVTPEERRLNVAAFYLHIIDEAVKGGFHELTLEECKNLVDDVLSGEKGCGHANEELFAYIRRTAETFNSQFYAGMLTKIPGQELGEFVENVRKLAERLADEFPTESFNRGDYKTSIPLFVEEMERYGFLPKETRKIGPVDQLGGMGVLVFMKA